MSRPLQNRVFPDGTLRAHPMRGTLMGNRGGRIHSDDKRILRLHANRQWIACVLAFKGRQRTVMSQGYTELFFLDEVTALAAGHRPCFECQRARATDFANHFPGPGRSRAPDMDRILHAERRGPRTKAPASTLPTGAMFQMDDTFFAVHNGHALRWSPDGYGPPDALPRDPVTVLTAPSILAALCAGFAPDFHATAHA